MSIIYERLQNGGADDTSGGEDGAGRKPADIPAAPGTSSHAPATAPATPTTNARRRVEPDRRTDRDTLRQLIADKRQLERALDRQRGLTEKQAARLKRLEIEARGRKPMTPAEGQSLAADVEQWRAKAAALQQDVYSSTHLLELAKQELDRQRKTQQELHTELARRNTDRLRVEELERECRQLREAVDQALADQELARSELAAEREAARAALQTSTEAYRQIQVELAQQRQRREDAESAHRHERQVLAERVVALEAAVAQPLWYLKLENGTILGPAAQDEIYEWACDCRLGPQHRSRGTDWRGCRQARWRPCAWNGWWIWSMAQASAP